MKLDEGIYAPGVPANVLRWLQATARKVNALASGSMSAREGSATAAPTAGTWAQGDEVRNSAPAEIGSAGAKYIVTGWICTAGGTPGTWREARALTGN